MTSSLKALLVDYMAVERMVVSSMLRNFHCEITLAKNGKEAVDMFLEGNEFDIVVCDKDMPIMTGPEAIVKIRAMGATDVKIVGVSADDNAMEAFMGAGADDFVPKPVRPEILQPMVQEVINKKKN
ncbi:two-component response regulator ORR42-like [Aegilops tauschii subsp. strangulata]|uniref:Response regulatory domain-containing protein n=1 Tax=Aegilops tauschii subsp. strangulata TaxID=200361 RepID=A0A453A5U6_AEGTS|nr:two-component response regulator ORR42-like [Aegilops tauschii subsp. strangulata]